MDLCKLKVELADCIEIELVRILTLLGFSPWSFCYAAGGEVAAECCWRLALKWALLAM